MMFKGSIVALITPFRDGRIDDSALQALVEWHVAQGTHGLVPCGTTGESPTLSHAEHERVIALCIEAAAGRLPIIAGTGSNSTLEAIALTKHARAAGADGALLVAPYYNRPTQEGLYQHFKAIHDAVDLPLILYNIPGRTAVDIAVETMARLAALPNIVGVKDATGNLARISRQRAVLGADFLQFCGDDALALAAMAAGAHGCISVTANVLPARCAAFQNACMSGDFLAARALHDEMFPLHEALFLETSPGPVKYAASLLGLCRAELRLPLVEPAEPTRRAVRDILATLAGGIGAEDARGRVGA